MPFARDDADTLVARISSSKIVPYLNHVGRHLDRDLQRHRLIVMLLLLPETHRPQSRNFEDGGGQRSIIVACLFAE